MSFTYTWNIIGTISNPCGTPLVILLHLNLSSLTSVPIFLALRWSSSTPLLYLCGLLCYVISILISFVVPYQFFFKFQIYAVHPSISPVLYPLFLSKRSGSWSHIILRLKNHRSEFYSFPGILYIILYDFFHILHLMLVSNTDLVWWFFCIFPLIYQLCSILLEF